MSTKIIQGENRLLPRSLTLADKVTPLPVAALARAEVALVQKGKVVDTFVLGTAPELRASAAAELTLEITTARSTSLAKGPVQERWTLERTDSAFLAEPGKQVDRIVLDDIEIV